MNGQIKNMKFNEKLELIKFGLNNILKEHTSYTGPTGHAVERKSKVRDLGIIMSEDATVNNHIDGILAKYRQLIGYILKAIQARLSLHYGKQSLYPM